MIDVRARCRNASSKARLYIFSVAAASSRALAWPPWACSTPQPWRQAPLSMCGPRNHRWTAPCDHRWPPSSSRCHRTARARLLINLVRLGFILVFIYIYYCYVRVLKCIYTYNIVLYTPCACVTVIVNATTQYIFITARCIYIYAMAICIRNL